MSRSRRWSITLNNPTLPLQELWQEQLFTYLVAGKEVGASGTPHFQIYVETVKKASLKPLADQLLGIWGTRPHLEASKGNAAQNKTYCTKDGEYVEHGKPMQPGARSDIAAVNAAIAEGDSIQQLWVDHPEVMVKYSRGIKELYLMTSPNMQQAAIHTYKLEDYPHWAGELAQITESLKSKTVILWGDSGLGKTCFARSILPNALFVSHMDDLTRYDTGTHDGIIFDDMSIAHLPRECQIQVVDFEQPRSIHVRYAVAMIPAGTKKIFTTNNFDGNIYSVGDAALDRRVFRIHLSKDEGEELKWDLPNWE